MSESYTTQDKDYLATHRTQTAAPHRGGEASGAPGSAATPSFLSAAAASASSTSSTSSVDSQPTQALSSSPASSAMAASSSNTAASGATVSSHQSLPAESHSMTLQPLHQQQQQQQQQQQHQHQQEQHRSLELGRCTQTSDTAQVSSDSSTRGSNAMVTSTELPCPSWSAVPAASPAISTASTEQCSNFGSSSNNNGPQGYSSSTLTDSSPQPLSSATVVVSGIVPRGTKRRGSDTCIVLMAVSTSAGALDDAQASSSSCYSYPCAKRVYRARSTVSNRKDRQLIAANASSPSLFAEFGDAAATASSEPSPLAPSASSAAEMDSVLSAASTSVRKLYLSSVSAPVSVLASQSASFSHGQQQQQPLPVKAATIDGASNASSCTLSKSSTKASSCSNDVSSNLHKTQQQQNVSGTRGMNRNSSVETATGSAENGYNNRSEQRAEATAENSRIGASFTFPVSAAITNSTAMAPRGKEAGDAAHSVTNKGEHAPRRALSDSALPSHVTDGVNAASSAANTNTLHSGGNPLQGSTNNSNSPSDDPSAMEIDSDEKEETQSVVRATITAATNRLGRSASAPASSSSDIGPVVSRSSLSSTRSLKHQQQQKASAKDSADSTLLISPRPQVCALPPINRYTLRELKIQNILQNPRLRHEVLFEPKLEFRPNSCGQLAEAKQCAAMQYWAVVEQEIKKDAYAVSASPSSVATITMLLVELREILAEMAEDSPKADLIQHAAELRERVDEQRIRQQLENRVFDAATVVSYMVTVMEQFAQPSRKALVARITVYVQRGRIVRALRAAFDILECIKIDTANSSIEMYREYMRSTAVAFERSHFNMALRRNSIVLSDTTEWWRRALVDGKKRKVGLEEIFSEAGRELVLDDGQAVPTLFRMDEARIQAIRKETERLSIVGMVFLAFMQFLQMARRNSSAAAASGQKAQGEFTNATTGRFDNERLAAECLQLLPEGCSVQWTEPLIGTRASVAKTGAAVPSGSNGSISGGSSAGSGAAARGEIGFSHLVSELVFLAERALARGLASAEMAMLERTLLRTARYECPLREVVEERVSGAIRMHTSALTALCGKVHGSEWEAMPQNAKETLRKSMLSFLAPCLSVLALKIHAVVSHHWQVYKTFYVAVSTSAASGNGNSSSNNNNSGSGASTGASQSNVSTSTLSAA
ncbi:T-complex protein 11-domain-containing protein [Coemansia spiralis]|nr:T-complex protein 11-domain-containing protein [Coemansia spiralis]